MQQRVFRSDGIHFARLRKASSISRSAHATQSGQIGIIIILIMVVLLTIGLSLAAQSSNEVTLSRQEDESTRVFNAAEAGVEQALGSSINSMTSDTYSGTANNVTSANATVNYTITRNHTLTTRLFQGLSANVQLWDQNKKPTVTSVTINWSKETSCSAPVPAALLVSIFSIDAFGNVTVRYEAHAACTNSDNLPVAAAGTAPYHSTVTIAVLPADAFMRIKPVYNDTDLNVTAGGGTLPVEYYSVVSTAKNNIGNETRAVQVNRTVPVPPSIMDYSLISGTTLVK